MGKKNNYKGISLYNAELAQARRDRHARLAAQLSEYGYKVELWEESLLHRKVLYIVSYAVPVAEWWTAPHKRNPFSRTYWTHRQTEQFRRDFDRIAAECDAAMEGFYHEHRSLFLDLTAKANESTTPCQP